MKEGKVYYLASPYTHDNAFVRNMRYEAVIYVASTLTKRGYRFIEPIAMCHDQSSKYGLPGGYEYWKDRDRDLIRRADAVLVVTLPGWETSIGVQDEINYAKRLGRTVEYIDYREIITEEALWDLYGARYAKTIDIS